MQQITTKVKPKKWRKSKHAACCVACESSFKAGDNVYEDGCLTIHVACLQLHYNQNVELGLIDPIKTKEQP